MYINKTKIPMQRTTIIESNYSLRINFLDRLLINTLVFAINIYLSNNINNLSILTVKIPSTSITFSLLIKLCVYKQVLIEIYINI